MNEQVDLNVVFLFEDNGLLEEARQELRDRLTALEQQRQNLEREQQELDAFASQMGPENYQLAQRFLQAHAEMLPVSVRDASFHIPSYDEFCRARGTFASVLLHITFKGTGQIFFDGKTSSLLSRGKIATTHVHPDRRQAALFVKMLCTCLFLRDVRYELDPRIRRLLDRAEEVV